MENAIKKGLGFGLTSGIITTLGLIVGLAAGTQLRSAVIGGVLVIAIADSMSDALGIHVAEESENHHTAKQIWQATLSTLFSKFLFALSFIIPLLLLPLTIAVIASVIWGLCLIAAFSYYIARQQKEVASYKVVFEHLLIAIVVIIATHYLGVWVNQIFS